MTFMKPEPKATRKKDRSKLKMLKLKPTLEVVKNKINPAEEGFIMKRTNLKNFQREKKGKDPSK